jgi:hypothetical protein
VLIRACYKNWSVSNELHLERPLQVCQQCNGLHKGPLQYRLVGPRSCHFRRDRVDAGSQYTSPLVEMEETHTHSKCLLSSRQRRHTYTRHVSFSRDRGDTRSQKASPFFETEETLYTRHVFFRRDRGDAS